MSLLGDGNVRHVHCIGVGGIGVSALAEILLQRGFTVSGSDANDSERLNYLRSLGAEIFVGHKSEQLKQSDMVVYSSAIDENNPEFRSAIAAGINLVKRGRLLADIMQFYRSVAVSGTHGKTTTTALISHLLIAAGIDPTYFIGGIPCNAKSPVHIGESDIFIAEADESDASFLYMQPTYAVVTNIECDHMSTYAGSEDELRQSFLLFLKHIPRDGHAILCIDDKNIQQLLPQVTCDVISYGVSEQAQYRITNYQQQGLHGVARIVTPTGMIDVELNSPGLHNMKNAVAAIITAHRLGVSDDAIIAALKTFPGVGRRFQSHGTFTAAHNTAAIYEDYGHHPTEIRETYKAARQAFPGQRVVLVFQPHRYTRTRDLFEDFVAVLSDVDQLILLPTYAASESMIDGATSEALCARLQALGSKAIVLEQVAVRDHLMQQLQDGDVVFFQGAGDVGKLAKELANG